MNPQPYADKLSVAVAAYCEAIDVPNCDDAAMEISNRTRTGSPPVSQRFPRVAVCVAAIVALLAVSFNAPAVVAEVHRVFAAFTVSSAGRTLPMTTREVNLEQARADVTFRVIAPPSSVAGSTVAINEVYAGSSPSDASIIFEIHGKSPGPSVMIVESKDGGDRSQTLFQLRGSAKSDVFPRFQSRERRTLSLNGRAFAPMSWVSHGTRVVVLSPPGSLSGVQLRAIQQAMSR